MSLHKGNFRFLSFLNGYGAIQLKGHGYVKLNLNRPPPAADRHKFDALPVHLINCPDGCFAHAKAWVVRHLGINDAAILIDDEMNYRFTFNTKRRRFFGVLQLLLNEKKQVLVRAFYPFLPVCDILAAWKTRCIRKGFESFLFCQGRGGRRWYWSILSDRYGIG